MVQYHNVLIEFSFARHVCLFIVKCICTLFALRDVRRRMHIAAGSLYVKNHFDEDSKKAALELVADVHQQFNIMLQELTWMDDTTK